MNASVLATNNARIGVRDRLTGTPTERRAAIAVDPGRVPGSCRAAAAWRTPDPGPDSDSRLISREPVHHHRERHQVVVRITGLRLVHLAPELRQQRQQAVVELRLPLRREAG